MPQGKQDAADGRLAYRINRGGVLERVAPGDAPSSVEVTERIVSAELVNGRLTVKVGATALMGGERLVNRTVELDATDDTLKKIDAAMQAVADAYMDTVEQQVMADGYAPESQAGAQDEEDAR